MNWMSTTNHGLARRGSYAFRLVIQSLAATGLAWAIAGCATEQVSGTEEPATTPEAPAETIELAKLMGDMQRHSVKLGFAIQGENQPLAEFYLHELHEVLEELEAVEEHEGMPIGGPAKVILDPALAELDARLDAASWGDAWTAYEATIEACNRCHLATEHDFIRILPASGTPPFNQVFTAPETAQIGS